jgi:hypothetical protein
MKKIVLIMVTATIMYSNGTFAEDKTDCAVHYTRTACSGQEAVSYKKCDGEQSCTKYKPADSLEACQDAALNSCKNKRLDITKSKVITAAYKGEPIQTPSGKDDFCLDYPNKDTEFNQCPEDK